MAPGGTSRYTGERCGTLNISNGDCTGTTTIGNYGQCMGFTYIASSWDDDYLIQIYKHLERLEKIAWLRWSWEFTEYLPKVKKLFLQTRLIHRKICFSLSGWLARTGKKKKDGK